MLSVERRQQREALLEELRQLGEFHRGSLNVQYRKCGKARCVCAQKKHPGHGPQRTLTYKEEAKTRTRNLPSEAAVRLSRQHIERHRQYRDWNRRWVRFNEEVAQERLEQLLEAEAEQGRSPEKKRRSFSGKRSSGSYRA